MPSYNGTNATLVQLIDTFKLIATEHSMLNSFFQGHPFEITEKTVLNYPLLVVDILPVQFDLQTIQYNFRVFVTDLVYEDRSNQLEVKSDSLRTIWDIVNMLGSENVFDLVVTTKDVIPFDDSFLTDNVAGFYLDIGIITPQTSSYCDVPFKN